ncbi:MAG: hypothetical protein QOF48_1128 [Verrucomicrobiota bacterium]|jgi:hypothetical protein
MDPNHNDSPDDTNPLHLGKFAPGQPDQPANPPAEEGATIFFRRVAADVAGQAAQPVVAPKAGNAMSGKDLLGAVAYCYAKGVYSSSEIEDQMLRDRGLRDATNEEIPNAQTIRRFRRLNRGAILQTLEKWYRKLRKTKPTGEVMPGAVPPESSPLPSSPAANASAPTENTSMFVKREAIDRLDKAAFIDSMEKE